MKNENETKEPPSYPVAPATLHDPHKTSPTINSS